ncbi:MAG: D-ribose pyranase [Oscillospiraceae bacterium]
MKKGGMLNAKLLGALAELRHLDSVVICDAGFPVPKGANLIDISLVAYLPTFDQTLKAVLNELIFEKYIIFDFMKDYNPEAYAMVHEMMPAQECEEIPMVPDFLERCKEAKLFIRTGELRPCSNIMLVSASGVESACKPLDVSFELTITP